MASINSSIARWLRDMVPLVVLGALWSSVALCGGCKEAEPAKSGDPAPATKDASQDTTASAAVSSNEEKKDEPQEPDHKEIKQVKTLKVLKKSDGAEKLVGKLKFESGKKTELLLEGDSPEAKQLKSDWEEVVAKGKIPLEVRETKEINGDMVTEINAVLVGPDDDRYYGAVWSYLERKYKYLVDVDY
jgi:hypothetical protein